MNLLKGKTGRLLRRGALCLSFAAAAVVGGFVVSHHMRPPPSAEFLMTKGTPGTDAPADPHASPATSAVFNYLAGLPNKSDHRLISGQWTGFGSVDTVEIERIEKMTGQRVGLVGADYLDFNGPAINPARINASMIDYWKQGSLVDIDVHFPNPWTGGGPSDMRVKNFSDVVTPGTPAYNAYRANLDQIAAGLKELQDAGVVVLFRPMMEMDANWFWWGQRAEFPKLWAQTFDYLTNTKGLHNLLWVYSTADHAPLAYYPGSQYVDIVGEDVYGYARGGKSAGYDEMLTTGKPFALAELGLQTSEYKKKANPPRDMHAAVRAIHRHMPATIYFMAWSNANGNGKNYWGIDAQNNVKPALNDPWVQNGAVPWNPPAAVSSPSPQPKK